MNRKVEDIVNTLIRSEIQNLSSYHVPEAKGMLKLDAMENPFSWPGEVQAAWLEKLKSLELNRYPSPAAEQVKAELRQVMGIDDSLDILLGNGSDEIIQMIAMALSGPDRQVLAPEPSFVMYRMISIFTGMGYQGVRLQDDFSLNLPAMIAAIEKNKPAVTFIAQPNNPTGNLFAESDIRCLIEASPGLVVIDEAYTAFTNTDMLNYAKAYPNVVIMRTLSKVGLAGLRLGMLIGAPAWLREFNKVRLPYNINSMTQASVEFALQNFELLKRQTDQIRQQRRDLYEFLCQLDAIEAYPSEANFILARVLNGRAIDIFEALKQEGILIKNLDGSHELLQNCLRLTVGSEAENARLKTALSKVFADAEL